MGCSQANTNSNTTVVPKSFKKIRRIGEGGFGEVYLIKSQETQREFALKKIKIKGSKIPINKIWDEVKNLRALDHPNIISFKGAFYSNDDNFLNIITEYAENGDFDTKIKINKKDKNYFEEKDILNWFFQVCLSLQYLSSKRIVHRDIKPSNIFLMENNTIKLGDFGLSKNISLLHRAKTLVGSPLYIAPELLKEMKEIKEIEKGKKKGKIKFIEYSYEIDIWSLGVTFCHIMSLEKPFDSEDDIINNIKSQKIFNKEKNCYIDKIVEKYSKNFLDLIDELMTYEPSKRPTIDEILEKPIVEERMKLY